MDSSSWFHGDAANSGGVGGNIGYMCGYAASYAPSASQYREEEQLHEMLLNSQIQQHLDQIRMEMNLDDVEAATYGGAAHSGDISTVMDDFDFLSSHHAAAACSFPSSSASTSFRSASLSCSPEISCRAPDVLSAPQISLQFPKVCSFVAPAGVVPSGMSTRASAFRRYEQHLSPRRRLTKPACGQRMFKTAMSALEKMHTAMKYSQKQQNQQYYCQQQQEQMLAAESSGNQLQHMISERKRREKLNDSFHALKTVLPPGSKKDKTSILIIAREYLTSLKSKVSELEEKNQALQALLAQRVTSGASADEDKTEAGEHVEIQITTAEGDQSGEICTVKIGMRPAHSNTTDTVLRTLQCLKEQMGEDVSLMSMRTDDGPHRAILTLHLKLASGAKWEEETVREVVTKALTGTLAP
ncbi:hypothetical protein QYE76_050844 [Lolium multiflorum]|uniref:BHLH domain-containing protein n=1 Tax=Lolium multiflorum TaxID=4521 RepID=A0AAD8SS44_LOLMU|nr:hypothetical protein QYE76_050844 [Lolium multiflorum]